MRQDHQAIAGIAVTLVLFGALLVLIGLLLNGGTP